MEYKIYKLVYNNQIVYIGRTTQKLNRRFSNGYKFIPFWKDCSIELIEITEDLSRERYWIDYYKNEGIELYNIQKGNTGISHSDDSYKKRFMRLYRQTEEGLQASRKAARDWRNRNLEDQRKIDRERNYNERRAEQRKNWYLLNRERILREKKDREQANKNKKIPC